MKVSITKESKKILTLEEAQVARQIILDRKEDEWSVTEYAEMAVNVVCGCSDHCVEVLKATAEINKNCRAWNVYSENSGTLDVWIKATAQTSEGFYIIGVYLSDIWEISDDNHAEIASHMFIRKFVEV